MKPIRAVAIFTFCGLVLSSSAIRADVRADEKSRVEFAGMLGRMVNIFGGRAAREGVTSTVAVKGDRKATLNDATGQIIDLKEEKIYDLDLKKKTYKVTTFAELRQQIEDARKKAEEEARKAPEAEKPAPADRDPNQKEVEIDFNVKDTGEKKALNGFDTHQVIMTITVREKGKTLEQSGGLVLTSDMWLAPKIAAMQEIAAFDLKYAQKLYGPMVSGISASQMAMVMATYPMMKDAMAKMRAEGSKLDGTAIQTTVTTEAVKSAEQLAQESKSADSKPSGGGLSGRLGGMIARKIGPKTDDAARPRTTFMTMNTEVLKVATSVSGEDVAVPAGFKENK
jgi:hypothetical protein